MASDQMRRAFAHRFDVERDGDVPDAAGVERGRRPAVEDAVEIAPADAGEARVPVVGDLLDLEHRDRMRPDQRVQAPRAAGAA